MAGYWQPMSEQQLDLARRGFDHFVETGEPQWETIGEDVEVYDHDIPDAGDYRGHAGYAKWLSDWGQAWDQFSVEPERWIEAGDKVVLVFQLTARGRGSGVEVKRRDAMVFTMRDGKTSRLDYFNNVPDALEAAGLPSDA
jgi:ketosteroid isomerase-like protein